jgi:hypothetical protein
MRWAPTTPATARQWRPSGPRTAPPDHRQHLRPDQTAWQRTQFAGRPARPGCIGNQGEGAHPGLLSATRRRRHPRQPTGNSASACKRRRNRNPVLQEMAATAAGKDVVLVAYSEFGRRVKANASQGLTNLDTAISRAPKTFETSATSCLRERCRQIRRRRSGRVGAGWGFLRSSPPGRRSTPLCWRR